MYITLDEFISLGGRDFDEAIEFDKVCRKAAGFIDYYTQGRLKAQADIAEGVKHAMYEICELLLERSEGITSYSSDGVSVKLSERVTADDKIYEIIRRNLPHKLLYLGVDKLEK